LRSREDEGDDGDNAQSSTSNPTYLTWGQVADWYLEQCESQIGDSLEELNRLTKLTNLVIRRLISKDHVLIYVGGEGVADTMEERDRKIAVHPNYVV